MIRVLRRCGMFHTSKVKDFKELQSPQVNVAENKQKDMYEPVLGSVVKRLPWLVILLVLGTGVSATVGVFEAIVAQLPVIMCFQSLILDMAGNVGTQSLAVVIRALMDSDFSAKKKFKLIVKECKIGLLNGVILGVLSFVIIGIFLCITGNGIGFSFSISFCLGFAMIVPMVISSFSGAFIPVFFQRIGIDPAVASGPLITTVNDMVAVVTYYGISWLILIQFLHLG